MCAKKASYNYLGLLSQAECLLALKYTEVSLLLDWTGQMPRPLGRPLTSCPQPALASLWSDTLHTAHGTGRRRVVTA
jgi:hypothetical protein